MPLKKNAGTSPEETSFLIRWSIQEIRRIAPANNLQSRIFRAKETRSKPVSSSGANHFRTPIQR